MSFAFLYSIIKACKPTSGLQAPKDHHRKQFTEKVSHNPGRSSGGIKTTRQGCPVF
jgi:hypothetical protein